MIWILTLLSVGFGAIGSFFMYLGAQSAPQQAVALCFGLALAVIPYCGARALESVSRSAKQAKAQEAAQTQVKILAAIANDIAGAARKRAEPPEPPPTPIPGTIPGQQL